MLIMKRIPFILVFVLFFSSSVFSQEQNSSQFYLKSVSAGIGVTGGEETSGGIGFNADVTAALNKNLFSLALATGTEIDLFEAHRNFFSADLLYGREFSVTKIFKIEAHAGLGIFSENYKNGDTNFREVNESMLGIPLRLKFLFAVTPKFSMGVNPNVNFNSIETMYSGNLVFQYNFRN